MFQNNYIKKSTSEKSGIWRVFADPVKYVCYVITCMLHIHIHKYPVYNINNIYALCNKMYVKYI